MHRRLLAVLTFPAVLFGAVAAAVLGLQLGYAELLLIPLVTVCAATLILIAQRLQPFREPWRDWGRDVVIDVTHTLISTTGASALVRAGLFGAIYVVAAQLNAVLGGQLWPEIPLVLQLGLALLITDFFAYWVHRLSHESELLWRLHALHHSSERLYMFSSGRNHPVHTALTYLAQMTPLILLGAPDQILALLAVFTAVHGMLQHANIDMRLGPFNWIFATCDLHRWHHSTAMAESNSNYGNNLIVWDVVFGTRFLPSHPRGPEQVGLEGVTFPKGYLAHLASPLTWPRILRGG